MRCRPIVLALLSLMLAAPFSTGVRAQTPQAETQKQIAVLQSSADLHEKARACQQLAAFGTAEAVPVLARLLDDEKLAAYARSALEAIPDASAGAALRKAMSTLRGKFLLGVINSLGVRRDTLAVAAIARHAGSSDLQLADASLTALAEIGTPDALRILQRALESRNADLRALAAQACLLAGDRQAAQGKQDAALGMYERVRRAEAPSHIRLAAVQSILVARGAGGVSLLVEQLGSSDPAVFEMALRATRRMPAIEVTRALAAQLARATPAAQPLLIGALLDRRDAAVLPAIERAASSGAPAARVAALTALGEIGAASSVPVLLKALETGTEAEAAAASASLTRMPSRESDAPTLAALPGARPEVQAKLVAVLAARRAPGAADAVLKLAASPDPAVALPSLRAMATLCRPGDLGELVRILVAAKDENCRDAAGQAILAAAAKLPDIGGRSAPIVAALSSGSNAATRAALLGLLSEIGTYSSYSVVKAALADADPQVRLAAARSLADWPDATPAAALLATASTAGDPTLRSVALRGAIRMAGSLAADCAYPSQQVVDWLQKAEQLVRDDVDSKRLLVSALGNLKNATGLLMLQPYLDDASVQNEAGLAAVKIARQMPPEQRAMARSTLEKVAAAARDDAVRTQAADALRETPTPGAELRAPEPPKGEIDVNALHFRPLFDGRTFEGWEGDTANAFRIEDGAIVGGNLKVALTQNEFLATTRSYANFVLRAECKLVGDANGGIQIRSQRVPRSSEMCGYQPDMDSSGQYWGCLYDESRRGMLVQADVTRTRQIVKPNDWNDYEIRAEGPRIRIYVNGMLTADYTEKDPEIPLSGLIGLQIHAGHPSETRYRNIRIAELP